MKQDMKTQWQHWQHLCQHDLCAYATIRPGTLCELLGHTPKHLLPTFLLPLLLSALLNIPWQDAVKNWKVRCKSKTWCGIWRNLNSRWGTQWIFFASSSSCSSDSCSSFLVFFEPAASPFPFLVICSPLACSFFTVVFAFAAFVLWQQLTPAAWNPACSGSPTRRGSRDE